MKKTLSLLLAVCLLMTAFSVNAFAADSSQEANANLTKEYTAIFLGQLNRGDIDGDNKVTHIISLPELRKVDMMYKTHIFVSILYHNFWEIQYKIVEIAPVDIGRLLDYYVYIKIKTGGGTHAP